MVTSMDDAIGEIISAADQHLPRDNTLIFFSSDNGGIPRLGSNGPLREGKSTLYEGGIRVVAMMAWDGKLESGSIVEEPLHMVDLYPTLLKLAGAKVDQKNPLDGKDAWPTIAEGKKTPHDHILLNVTPFGGAIRMGDWKLVHNGAATANATSVMGPETWELFNLNQDPSETTNLVLKNSRIFRRLKSQLDRFEVEAVPPHIPPNRMPENFKVPKVWGHSD